MADSAAAGSSASAGRSVAASSSSSSSAATFRVAIVGGGIAGACAASVLSSAAAVGAGAVAGRRAGSAGTRDDDDDDDDGSSAPEVVEPATKTWTAEGSPPPPAPPLSLPPGVRIRVDLYDQGRRGVGGRSSHRRVVEKVDEGGGSEEVMAWDHGCQFFRADTDRFKPVVSNWMKHGFVKEWKGRFVHRNAGRTGAEGSNGGGGGGGGGFFGMPSMPPFYVGADEEHGGGGMQSIPRRLLELCAARKERNGDGDDDGTEETILSDPILEVFTGTRVSRIERRADGGDDGDAAHSAGGMGGKWSLFGTSGTAAYHDTPEHAAESALAESGGDVRLGRRDCDRDYDAVVLTDASSSFGTWHRASAGVPEDFASRVRERVGARVPLFSAMVAFEGRLDVPFDAISFDDGGGIGGSGSGDDDDDDITKLWFAARSSSKPGMRGEDEGEGKGKGMPSRDCWTLVSTPEYALSKIRETPMQDPNTGEFVPQSADYLTSVPGPELERAFREALLTRSGMGDGDDVPGRTDGTMAAAVDPAPSALPETVYLDAQRWGSAMPCHRHLDERSGTRRTVSGVPYDTGRAPLAPTRMEEGRGGAARSEKDDDDDDDATNFLADDDRMLFQAGDMVSGYTPGFEGAAISGMDAAEHILRLLRRDESFFMSGGNQANETRCKR